MHVGVYIYVYICTYTFVDSVLDAAPLHPKPSDPFFVVNTYI